MLKRWDLESIERCYVGLATLPAVFVSLTPEFTYSEQKKFSIFGRKNHLKFTSIPHFTHASTPSHRNSLPCTPQCSCLCDETPETPPTCPKAAPSPPPSSAPGPPQLAKSPSLCLQNVIVLSSPPVIRGSLVMEVPLLPDIVVSSRHLLFKLVNILHNILPHQLDS